MTTLVTPANVKAIINTSMSDVNLQTVIDRIEAQVNAKIGAPQTDEYATSVVKTLRGEGPSLFLPTEIYSVTSIVEDGTTLTSDQYQTWGGGVIERLPLETDWGDRCVVTYKPADDRLKRTQAIIDLVRLVIERTAMESESIAGEYSYTAPDDWNKEFRKAMKSLMFQAI